MMKITGMKVNHKENPIGYDFPYLCGLGLYEVYVDGEKAGDEYLMPGYHSYDLTQEYQTIDLTAALTKGAHDLSVMLGNGWYKGRFVFEGGFENLYGDCLKLIAELHITYADGSRQIIGTDDSWTAETTKIGANNIYDGEAQDGRLAAHPVSCTVDGGGKDLLCARTSMPIRAAGEIAPVRILSTPAGETVLDFGQVIFRPGTERFRMTRIRAPGPSHRRSTGSSPMSVLPKCVIF